jgi:hypothetical protein
LWYEHFSYIRTRRNISVFIRFRHAHKRNFLPQLKCSRLGNKSWQSDCSNVYGIIDYTRCLTVYLSAMIFVSAIFARPAITPDDACDTYCQNGAYCQNACVTAHVSWRGLHLLPKWRPTRAHKKSRTQFWLSDSSGTSELKQVTFLTTRTPTGSKVDVFNHSP